jgi:integrase
VKEGGEIVRPVSSTRQITPAPEPVFAARDVAAEMARWLGHLGAERRMSAKTVEAYERDVRQFLGFLAEHLGGRPTLAELARLTPQDVRAFMAARRADGIGGRSLMRALAGVRSFARFLERNGKGKVGALAAVRAPKVPKTLPKPLAIVSAKRVTDADERAGEEREQWILARDAAVLALLYGSGLRISEALGLARGDVPAPGKGDAITVTGKGNKQRMVPLLPGVAIDRRLRVAVPPRSSRRRPAVHRRARRALIAAHRAACHGTIARRAQPAGLGDAACAAPFVRHASSGARRRFARHPGVARPRLALDDADIHRC